MLTKRKGRERKPCFVPHVIRSFDLYSEHIFIIPCYVTYVCEIQYNVNLKRGFADPIFKRVFVYLIGIYFRLSCKVSSPLSRYSNSSAKLVTSIETSSISVISRKWTDYHFADDTILSVDYLDSIWVKRCTYQLWRLM